jgi:hypothetical protein
MAGPPMKLPDLRRQVPARGSNLTDLVVIFVDERVDPQIAQIFTDWKDIRIEFICG